MVLGDEKKQVNQQFPNVVVTVHVMALIEEVI